MDVSVVVPVHNERESLEGLIREVHDALAGREFEVIYVDDESSDGTAAELERLLGVLPRLRALRHRRRSGQSAALWTGVRAARAPWIATLDGDGQNDPADIPRLLDVLAGLGPRTRVELVAGIRAKRHDSWLRRLSSRVANGVRSRLLRDGVSDTGCGLKLVLREAYLRLPYFDHMHRFLPALIRRGGGDVATVPVGHRPRERGKSKYGLFDRLWVGITDLFGVMWLQRRASIPAAEEVAVPAGSPGPREAGALLDAEIRR
jgi:dolichol-phosphate mannosyltransferase